MKFIKIKDNYLNANEVKSFRIKDKDFFPYSSPDYSPYDQRIYVSNEEPYVLEVIYLNKDYECFHLTIDDYLSFVEQINQIN
jgi:hypothetical protein